MPELQEAFSVGVLQVGSPILQGKANAAVPVTDSHAAIDSIGLPITLEDGAFAVAVGVRNGQSKLGFGAMQIKDSAKEEERGEMT